MEAESRSLQMRIHSMGRKEFGFLFVVFFLLFLICIIVGVTGPDPRQQLSDEGYTCPEETNVYDPQICTGVDIANNGTWVGKIIDLTLFNQEVELQIGIINKLFQQKDVSTEVPFRVDIEASNDNYNHQFFPITTNDVQSRKVYCSKEATVCDSITLARLVSIDYHAYRFTVSADYHPTNTSNFFGDVIYTIDYGNAEYSKFELAFRMVFLGISIGVVIYFTLQTRKIAWKNWTLEQQWTLALLLGLIGYDNPFFPINVTVGGWFPVFLDQLLFVSFVSMLLFFWIIMYDGIRLDGAEKTFVRFYLPKVSIVGLFWVSGNIVYSWFSLHEILDPVYSTDITSNPGFVLFSVVFGIVAVAYVFYVLWAVGKAYQHSRTIPLLSLRLKALGVFTALIIIAVVVGVVFNFVGSRSTDTSQFLTYLGLFNLYVYLLTYVYLPAPYAANTQGVVGMMRLDEKHGGQVQERPTPHDPSEDAMDVIFLEDAMQSNM